VTSVTILCDECDELLIVYQDTSMTCLDNIGDNIGHTDNGIILVTLTMTCLDIVTMTCLDMYIYTYTYIVYCVTSIIKTRHCQSHNIIKTRH